MADAVELLLTVDDAYFDSFLVAILSVVSGSSAAVRLHVISSLDDARSARLRRVLHRLDLDFTLHTPAELHRQFGGETPAIAGFLSDPHYFRLLMGRILTELPRVLYLDSDLVVRGDIAALWRQDLHGAIVGAVADPSFLPEEETAFRAHYDGRYFNSGVMLVDLDRWRGERAELAVAEAIALFSRNGNAGVWRSFWDQSPINWALRGRWHGLHPAWNMTPVTRPDFAAAYGLDPDAMNAAIGDPALYHFVGPFKPWVPRFANWNHFSAEHVALARLARGLAGRWGEPH